MSMEDIGGYQFMTLISTFSTMDYTTSHNSVPGNWCYLLTEESKKDGS